MFDWLRKFFTKKKPGKKAIKNVSRVSSSTRVNEKEELSIDWGSLSLPSQHRLMCDYVRHKLDTDDDFRRRFLILLRIYLDEK